MRCDNFEIRLNEVLDQRGSPSEDRELRAHAQSCATCRDLLIGQQLVFTGLDMADPPAMSSGFTGKVLARLATADVSESGAAGIIAPAAPLIGMHLATWWIGGIVAAALAVGFIGYEPLKALLSPSAP